MVLSVLLAVDVDSTTVNSERQIEKIAKHGSASSASDFDANM